MTMYRTCPASSSTAGRRSDARSIVLSFMTTLLVLSSPRDSPPTPGLPWAGTLAHQPHRFTRLHQSPRESGPCARRLLPAKTATCRGDLLIAAARRLSWWARVVVTGAAHASVLGGELISPPSRCLMAFVLGDPED